MIVYKGTSYHKAVEYLVAVKPNVNFAREESLRDPEGVEESASDVKEPHEDKPAQTSLSDGLLPPVLHRIVRGRRYPWEPEHDEDQSSVGTVPRGPELVP